MSRSVTPVNKTITFTLPSVDTEVTYMYGDTLIALVDVNSDGIALEVTPAEARGIAALLNAAVDEYENHESESERP